jgi:hypothetical protein
MFKCSIIQWLNSMKHFLAIMSLSIVIFTSCSPMKKTFEHDLQAHFQSSDGSEKVLTKKDISHLPEPVQRYFEYCGFIGKPVPMNAEVVWAGSHIKMAPDKKWMKLKTIQYNSVEEPFRIAYMRALMFGLIPFDGRDIYFGGQGHMYGKVANLITIFDEKEKEIAQSALITILAEALLVPGYALADYISWEPIDENSAKARLVHKGIDVSGIFYFNEIGELIRFETNDRYYMHPDKGNVLTPFSADVGDYKQQGELRIPVSLMAVWHLDSGRYEYWKGTISEVKYNIRL